MSRPTLKAALVLLALAAVVIVLVVGPGRHQASNPPSSQAAPGKSSGNFTPGAAEAVPLAPLEPGYVDWPMFGRVPQRTHYLPADQGSIDRPLDPPLKQAWSINTHALIEFPPAIHRGFAFVINKYGNAKAIQLSDHKVIWGFNLDPQDKGHQVTVTAPVYYRGRLFGAILDGHVAAGDAVTGKELWLRDLHTHLESSPLAVDGNLYLGTDGGQVIALDAGDGKTVWSFKAPGAIKASPSYDGGNIFVADYQSSMYALNADTGKPVWRTNTSKVAPYGSGGFFSSPAVAFGDVYAARDDGTVYAFDEGTGKVKWSFDAGAAVYGSPAVAEVPGTPPTVYIGAENGRFYALNARTGKVEWSYDVGGPVPGTATVIGHTVYVSSFKTRQTIGIDVRTHKRDFEIGESGYTPMVSDGRQLILVGYYTVIGLEPTKP